MFKSVVWEFAGKFSNQIISFVTSVILTRILLPGEFGVMGILLVFISFSGVLFDFGFKNAIINHSALTNDALSSIFYINIVVALAVAGIVFLGASPIARFYQEPALEPLLRVATIILLVNAAAIVPTALNQKNLKFKANATVAVFATIISGVVSIVMAYYGYGVWSILMKNILYAIIVGLLGWVVSKWQPQLRFSFKSVQPMLGYSSTLFLTVVLDSLFQRMDVLIIGKLYNSKTVGYYTRAQTLEGVTRDLTSGIVYSVFFPYFSRVKENIVEVRQIYDRCLHVVAFVLLMMNGILLLSARQVIVLLFTSKWLPAVVYFQFFLVIGFLATINTIMSILIASTGNHKMFLRSDLLRKAVLIPAYVLGFLGNIQIFLWSLVVAYTAMLLVNLFFTSRITKIRIRQQVATLLSYLLPSLIAGVVSWLLLHQYFSNNIAHLLFVSTLYFALTLSFNIILKNKGVQVLYAKFPKLRKGPNHRLGQQVL